MANAQLNLTELNGSNGFTINGIAGSRSFGNGDFSGFSVSGAGDLNSDGIDDLIIGAPFAYANGKQAAGQSYVLFGTRNGFSPSLNLSSLDGSNGFAINGSTRYDQSGSSVSGAGDINGDGIDDLIIGAFHADSVDGFTVSAPGQSYVVFGSRSGFSASLNLSSLNGSNGFAINGIAIGDQSGNSVSGAGDINGDGIADLIVGANPANANGNVHTGQSYVVFGNRSGFSASLNLSSLNGSNGFAINGIAVRDYSGHSVSGAGDVNGDGIDDLIIGAAGSGVSRITSGANQSYVVFGSRSGFSASLNLSSLNGSNGFILNGGLFDGAGFSASGAGDINGDGLNDLIVGAEDASPNSNDGVGQSYVVFGSRSFSAFLDFRDLNGSNGFALNGVERRSRSGNSVSGAGDVNGDGIDDLIIGAHYASPNGNNAAGQTYVVFGSRSGFSASFNLSSLNGSNGFALNGIAIGDQSGNSVSGAGDINGDDIADLIIGADQADPNGNDKAGQSYVVFGIRGSTAPTVSAPMVSVIPNQVTNEDIPTAAIPFTIADLDTPISELTLTANSSNPTLIPDGNITLEGTGANRTITLTPAVAQSGVATITLSISDGSVATITSFEFVVNLAVNPVNSAPVTVGDALTANQTTPKTILASALLANDADLEGDRLVITSVGNASNGSVILVNDMILYTPDPSFSGVTTFDYSLTDGKGGSDTGQVTLTIGKTQKGSNRNDTFSGTGGEDNFTDRKGNDRLSGNAGNDFLSGGQGKDTLLGGDGNDILVGGQAADRLTGGRDSDTFVLAKLKDSLLSEFDRITDLTIGTDQIDGPRAIAAGQVVQGGTVRQLKAGSIADVLTTRAFAAHSAATFTVGTGRRQQTFLALNNGTAGFSASSDAIINITDYSGRLADLAIG